MNCRWINRDFFYHNGIGFYSRLFRRYHNGESKGKRAPDDLNRESSKREMCRESLAHGRMDGQRVLHIKNGKLSRPKTGQPVNLLVSLIYSTKSVILLIARLLREALLTLAIWLPKLVVFRTAQFVYNSEGSLHMPTHNIFLRSLCP